MAFQTFTNRSASSNSSPSSDRPAVPADNTKTTKSDDKEVDKRGGGVGDFQVMVHVEFLWKWQELQSFCRWWEWPLSVDEQFSRRWWEWQSPGSGESRNPTGGNGRSCMGSCNSRSSVGSGTGVVTGRKTGADRFPLNLFYSLANT